MSSDSFIVRWGSKREIIRGEDALDTGASRSIQPEPPSDVHLDVSCPIAAHCEEPLAEPTSGEFNCQGQESAAATHLEQDIYKATSREVPGTKPSAAEKLDRKSDFWEEYNKVSKEYDEALVKDLGDDLNSLLTFAGLFSATNTAFILETMNDLREDPAEVTNNLLRTIARNLQNPSVVDKASQAPAFTASKRAVRVNALLFA
ncbi:hypothetical protein FRC03_006598, partial [Tulasnella sp. 419]